MRIVRPEALEHNPTFPLPACHKPIMYDLIISDIDGCLSPEDSSPLNIEKLNEEVEELIEAIQKNDNQVHEAADVLYHLLVLLEGSGIKIEKVMEELKKRQNEIR